MSDALQVANVETVEWSTAELEEFNERVKAYHEATDKVNKWIQFLVKQHGVKQEDGWQLGETGFVREKKAPAPVAEDRPWTEPKVVAPPEPVVAGNGAHG